MFGIRQACLAMLLLAGTHAQHVATSKVLRGNSGKDLDSGHRRSLQDNRPEHDNEKCFAPDCRLETGTYVNPGGDEAKWWAFVPTGSVACPAEGCPLFVAVDGTRDEFFDPFDQQTWMIEMVQRGFVGVTMEYSAAYGEFGFCNQAHGIGSVLNMGGSYGLVEKAEKIFDPADEGSVIHQLCDGPEALANCDLGIAVQGVSQGSLILGQATNLEKRISAALLWAVGDVIQMLRSGFGPVDPFSDDYKESLDDQWTDFSLPCMDSFQLPPPRMRLINGDNDRFFGRNAAGSIQQHKHMINNFYDCGDSRDCLTRTPSTTMDTYTGGMIADEGGYFIVDGGTHTSWFRCVEDEDEECTAPSEIFTNTAIYGGPAGYDWLARTARIPYTPAQGSNFDSISMQLDLAHWRSVTSGSDMGFFVEWAAGNGVLGERTRVADGAVYQMTAEFSGEDVPVDTIGFRLSASSTDGAFLDQLHVRNSEGDIFKGLSFGENNGGGWCISMDPRDTFWFIDCFEDQAFRCIDFCTGSTGEVENFHFCDNNDLSMCLSDDDGHAAIE